MGRGKSLNAPLEWCDNQQWVNEYKEIEKMQAQAVREYTAKKITLEDTTLG